MENLNRVELRGVVGNVRVQNAADRKVYHVALATSRAYKDRNGNAIIETTWHQIVLWDNFADLSKIEKGTKLYVCGRIRNQKYTNSADEPRQVFEVVANKMQIIDTSEPLQYEM